jgi:hypothetical protein
MASVNPMALDIRLRKLLEHDDAWGSEEGSEVREKILRAIDARPEATVIRVSLAGVRRTDTSFARESVMEVAYRLRGRKGVCVTDIPSRDVFDNWNAAALAREQTMVVWGAKGPELIGPQPSEDTWELLKLVLDRGDVNTAEAARALDKQVNNVSTRFKRLAEEGLVLRREVSAPTGGLEFRYLAIR